MDPETGADNPTGEEAAAPAAAAEAADDGAGVSAFENKFGIGMALSSRYTLHRIFRRFCTLENVRFTSANRFDRFVGFSLISVFSWVDDFESPVGAAAVVVVGGAGLSVVVVEPRSFPCSCSEQHDSRYATVNSER